MDKAIVFEGSRKQSASVAVKNTKRIALIIVDAHTDQDCGSDVNGGVPGLDALLGSTGSAAISRYSCERIELYREIQMRLTRDRLHAISKSTPGFSTYVVELHFHQLANDRDRRFFNSVPTTFELPAKTVDRLRQLAARQLATNEEYRRLVRDLGGRPTDPDSPDRQQLATAKQP